MYHQDGTESEAGQEGHDSSVDDDVVVQRARVVESLRDQRLDRFNLGGHPVVERKFITNRDGTGGDKDAVRIEVARWREGDATSRRGGEMNKVRMDVHFSMGEHIDIGKGFVSGANAVAEIRIVGPSSSSTVARAAKHTFFPPSSVTNGDASKY